MTDDRDLYKVLQVDPEADPDVITAAFRALARKVHPDIDSMGVQEHRMSELNRAYMILRDPAERKTYDLMRARKPLPMGPGRQPLGDQLPSHLSARLNSLREGTDEAGQVKLDFGRYEGQTLREVANYDPDYLRWLSRHSSGIRFRSAILRVLDERPSPTYSGRPSR